MVPLDAASHTSRDLLGGEEREQRVWQVLQVLRVLMMLAMAIPARLALLLLPHSQCPHAFICNVMIRADEPSPSCPPALLPSRRPAPLSCQSPGRLQLHAVCSVLESLVPPAVLPCCREQALVKFACHLLHCQPQPDGLPETELAWCSSATQRRWRAGQRSWAMV